LRKTTEHKERILGDMGPEVFARTAIGSLRSSGGRPARWSTRTIKTEARTIAENAQTTIAASAAMEVGAVGLGALVTTIATTAAADVTGVLMAGVIAALGLFIIPARRRQGQTKMLKKISDLRTGLTQSMKTEFEREIKRSLQHIQEASPLTRVRPWEREKLLEAQTQLKHLQTEMGS
jgi:hypothetical protein